MSLIQGKTGEWEVVIGLEVHAQAIAESKLFSGAATTFGAAPNTQVSLVDAAMPGMLPVLNRRALEQAVKTGLGLNAKINLESVFERKNYFYPDLPQGYQISQYLQPIVGAGRVMLDLPDGATKDVAVERLHLEQDAGKSLHDQHPSETYIDLNRAGVTLMEIVSKPDLRSAEEAGAYLEKLRSILRYLGTCTGNMEEGSMRCDVNLSVRRPGADLGTRTETKNVNSIRFVKQAIEYEAKRQVALIEDGGTVEQETRLFDPDKGTTRAMRSKEEAHDYRYFPDPDLLPVVLEADWVEALRRALPELPDAKKARFLRNYQLSPYQAAILVSDKDLADAFEETVHGVLRRKLEDNEASSAISFSIDPNANIDSSPYGLVVESSAASSAKMILGDVFKVANETGQDPAALIRRLDLRGLMQLIDDDIISGRLAKDVFQAMCETGQHAAAIVEAKGLRQISDAGAIETIVESVVADNPEQAAQFRAGNEKVLGWLVGQVMKASQGRANPAMVNRLLRQKLA